MKLAYRPDIDGLRAVAVVSVVLYHAFPEYFSGGFIGVDVFFVISGYLITSILLIEHAQSTWGLLDFYARRILRIFPALILILLFCFFVGWYVMFADEYKQLGKHILSGMGFFSNFVFWFEAGYFDRASDLKPLLHLWSLGIEEQFYIFWPLILWILYRSDVRLKWILIGLGLLSIIYATISVDIDRTAAFYSPLSRAWELGLGAFLAIQVGRGYSLSWIRGIDSRIHTTAFLTLVCAVFFISQTDPFPGLLALIPTFSAFLIMASGAHHEKSNISYKLLTSRSMVFVGLISYPLYLWHWPLLSFARIVYSGDLSLAIRITLVAVSFLLAVATYLFIEKPLRRVRRWISLTVLMVMAIVVAVLGWNVYHRDGLERIRHKRMIQLDERSQSDFSDFENTGLFNVSDCQQPFKFPEKDVCLVHSPNAAVTAVALGDSHAVHAYWGLSQAYALAGLNLKVMGKGACMPLINYPRQNDSGHCQSHMNAAVRSIANDPAIHRVALIFRGRYLGVSPNALILNDYSESLRQTLKVLTDAGKKIDFFLSIAEPEFDPRLCVGNLPLGRKAPRSCIIDLDEQETKTQALRQASLTVIDEFKNVSVIDPNMYFCQNRRCPILQEGHSMFKDDNHLSYHGSMLIARELNVGKFNH
jgi:peptidoglycan/LPS O-acetylase OafA/YrhL